METENKKKHKKKKTKRNLEIREKKLLSIVQPQVSLRKKKKNRKIRFLFV